MKKEKLVAILTPTYNRSYLLNRLYQSLLKQTTFDFVWYIVDDGSNDDTSEAVLQFYNEHFEVKYVYKENGGKHTALNTGIEMIKEELTFIVDSDDYLTEDAIAIISQNWKKYADDCKICGLSFYRLTPELKIIGEKFPLEEVVDSYAEMRINKRVLGDKAEVWRTAILKKFPFPVYMNEKFLSEAIVWNAISAAGYKTVYLSKGIYVGDYLEGGLTKTGKKLRLETPYGTLDHARSFFYEDIRLKVRLKYIVYYDAVAIYSKKIRYAFSKCHGIYKTGFVAAFVPSCLIVLYWRNKYK